MQLYMCLLPQSLQFRCRFGSFQHEITGQSSMSALLWQLTSSCPNNEAPQASTGSLAPSPRASSTLAGFHPIDRSIDPALQPSFLKLAVIGARVRVCACWSLEKLRRALLPLSPLSLLPFTLIGTPSVHNNDRRSFRFHSEACRKHGGVEGGGESVSAPSAHLTVADSQMLTSFSSSLRQRLLRQQRHLAWPSYP